MDSEHRHELKENELLEFLRNFKEWWDKHGTRTLGTILIAIAVMGLATWWFGLFGYPSRQARAREQAWTALASARSPEAKKQLAQTHRKDHPGLAAMALLSAADEIYGNALFGSYEGSGIDATRNSPSDATRAQLQRAAALYQQTLDTPAPGEPSAVHLNARLGLAAVHETLGNWDEAQRHYEATWKAAGPYRAIARLAEQRLADLDRRRQPITFPVDPNAGDPNATDPNAADPNAPAQQFLDDGSLGGEDEPTLLPAPQTSP